MKRLIAVLCLMFIPVISFANPYDLNVGIEKEWSKLALPTKTHQYDDEIQGYLRGTLELRDDLSFAGKVAYPFDSERPEFSIGLEYRLFYGGSK